MTDQPCHDDHFDTAAIAGANGTLGAPISPDGTPVPGRSYTVPARQGRAVRVGRGQVIRIVNPHGTQVCDTWAFNAWNRSEYLSWPHARAWISRLLPRVGDPLVTNRRRPILTMIEDTSSGVHDTLMAACDIFRYRTLGVQGYHDNCSDNLRMAMMAIGQPVPHVPQPFNLWMNIPVQPDLSVDWLAPVSRPGDFVRLRAEMDCIVAMSACPQDMIPINGKDMTPLELSFTIEAA
jgi:uncharacterized protein YcgI (DUF1989 family)